MNALDRALQQIAIGQAEQAFKAALAADVRHQFLIETAQANRVDFDERHYGAAGREHLFQHMASAAPWRRQRASTLALIRRAKLFDGCQCFAKYRAELTRCRREEKHAAGMAVCAANLAAVDAVLGVDVSGDAPALVAEAA